MIHQSLDTLKDFDSVKRQREHVIKDDNFFGVENKLSSSPPLGWVLVELVR
jgi:hypothetical protein